MKLFILIFFFLFFIKLMVNFIRYKNTNFIIKLYDDYLHTGNESILEYWILAKKLFKLADLKMKYIYVVGHGNLDSVTNFPFHHPDLIKGHTGMLKRTKGVFRDRMIECFYPLFWIVSPFTVTSYILNQVFSSFGFNLSSIFFRFFIGSISVIAWAVTVIIALYTTEARNYADQIIKKVF